ncbi:DUF6636 domain-containing protein [Mycobacterium asiaticum]|uniref:DUF6636 domain-containing protein n=1 Tax=Mycobacterium asiaticum TaxID=1790 RepID=UPI0009C061CB|nr:DUF6636 domain-containing protein [Mycobacterium asiaticum]
MMPNRASAGFVAAFVVTALAAPEPTAHAAGLEFFQTPSGNIGCGIGPMESSAFAGCEIREHSYPVPPRPNPCMGAWGSRISMHQGAPAQMSCHSDTILGTGYPVLQYGQTRSFNSITCESQESGITCTDHSTGHYFRLSRDAYELH